MMKKLLMGLMLLLVSGAASAAWFNFGESEDATLYIEMARVRKNGNFAIMWDLADFKKVRVIAGKSVLSRRVQGEYDCKEERVRTLALTTFSGQMANGEVIYTQNITEEWMAVGPGSVAELLWKLACGKK